ncbi:MAG: ArnT family glycosyltransferase [Pyrinomonadaceae bacterium]
MRIAVAGDEGWAADGATAARQTAFLREHTVAGCVVVAFALRLLLVTCVEGVISPDGVIYAGLARQLAAGNLRAGLSTYYPPLYPALVALSSLVCRDVEFAGRFVSVVAGALTVVPAYLIAREWYGARVARLAAIVVALHPVLVYYSSLVLTEATYTLLFACGVLAGWRALNGRDARTHFLAGAIFGACYLLKPEAAGFVVLLLLLRVAASFRARARSFRRTALDCLAHLSGFALFALPYLIYLRGALGAWTLSGKLVPAHLWQGSGRAGAFASAAVVPGFSTALAQTLKGLGNEYIFLSLLFPAPFVALAALGLWRAGWTRARARRELYLGAFVAATLAGYAVTLPNIRFLVPLLPLLVCWLAQGVAEFEGWLAETLRRARAGDEDEETNSHFTAALVAPRVARLVSALVVVVLLASLTPVTIFLLRGDKWGDYHGQKLAAVWIREHSATRPPRVMAVVPVPAFYSGGEHVALVAEDYDSFLSRARRGRADFVVANERSLKGTPLGVLLDERAEHPSLRLLNRFADAPDQRIFVYAVAGS